MNKEELVTAVSLSADLIRKSFPNASSELLKYSPNLQVIQRQADGDNVHFVELQLKTPFTTHWESIKGETGRAVIRISYEAKEDEDADIHVVVRDEDTTEEERVGRLLVSDAKYFEIRNSREFLPLLINIIDTYNKAHLKKIPTIVNTYKAMNVSMVEEDENVPLNSFMASLLRNIPGVSEEVAKQITREYKTIDGLVAALSTLEHFRFPSGSNTRGLSKPVIERLRALFGSTSKGSDVVMRDE
jgi:hypothetical protein